MRPYHDQWRMVHGQLRLKHSWEIDIRQRLVWLYGDADERVEDQSADLEAWRGLGRRKEG